MTAKLWIILAVGPILAASQHLPPWPQAGPMPDDPAIGGPSRYQSIMGGTKSYRPVEPLPWDELNRRVAPKGALPQKEPPVPNAKDGKTAPAERQKPEHKH